MKNIVQKIAWLSKKCDVLVMFEVSEWACTVLEILELNKETKGSSHEKKTVKKGDIVH